MKEYELEIIAGLTIELVKLRQNECSHLAIENNGPEIFGKLIEAFHESQSMKVEITPVKLEDYLGVGSEA